MKVRNFFLAEVIDYLLDYLELLAQNFFLEGASRNRLNSR